MHGDSPGCERQRDAAGADGELECGPAPRQAGEKVDRGFDDRRLEHLGVVLVIPRGNVPPEPVLVHARTLPGVRAP